MGITPGGSNASVSPIDGREGFSTNPGDYDDDLSAFGGPGDSAYGAGGARDSGRDRSLWEQIKDFLGIESGTLSVTPGIGPVTGNVQGLWADTLANTFGVHSYPPGERERLQGWYGSSPGISSLNSRYLGRWGVGRIWRELPPAPVATRLVVRAGGMMPARLGKRVDARLAELVADLPIGIEIHRLHWQSRRGEGRTSPPARRPTMPWSRRPCRGCVFGLAVTIMAGLTIGTGFTMIVVPVLYATFYGILAREAARSESPGPGEQRRSRPAEAWPPAYHFAGFDRHRGRGTKAL